MRHSPRPLPMIHAAVLAVTAGWISSTATVAAEKPKPAAESETPKSITYTGRVLDRVSGKPVTGAAITIERAVSPTPLKKEKPYKRISNVKTNAKGEYSFTLKPDEAARPKLYVVVRAEHPDYAAKRSGYSYAMLRKNKRLGESPFFSEIKLWPGKQVRAILVTPDGSPVSGAKIVMFCRHERATRFDFGGFHETKTDRNGRFQFAVSTPGAGAFWIYPKGYAVQGHLLTKRRGDLGKIVVQKGTRLKGRVLDAKGKPVAGVYVGVRQARGDTELDAFLNENAVGNLISRSTHSNQKGEFEIDDLPDGNYSLGVEPNRNEFAAPAKHVFLRRAIKLSAAEKAAPLTVRAVPHVELHASWVDGKGKPTRGYQFYVFGRLDGRFWSGRSTRPDPKTGKVVVAAPHGLQDAALNLITNEHRSIRWRLKPGDPLRRGRRVPLGDLDDDRRGIQIVHYTSPILLIKPVDESGKVVRDVKIESEYEPQKPPDRFGGRYSTGDVRFQQQKDGRWRSSQMQPDVAVTIALKKDGYESKPQKLTLKEGKERELVFVLKKLPEVTKPPQTKAKKK